MELLTHNTDFVGLGFKKLKTGSPNVVNRNKETIYVKEGVRCEVKENQLRVSIESVYCSTEVFPETTDDLSVLVRCTVRRD